MPDNAESFLGLESKTSSGGSPSAVPPLLQSNAANEQLGQASMPIALGILMALTGLGILGSLVIVLVGSGTDNPVAVGGGIICFPLYIAILVGLIKKQEWARVMLIWMTYCGIAGDLFRSFAGADRLPGTVLAIFGIGIGIGVFTLILAHSTSVKSLTKNQSLAKEYIYQEPASSPQAPQPVAQNPEQH